jgi:hypothetical protein
MFRFTIRDVLWLTVVVALGLAWWVDRTRLNRTARAWETAATLLHGQLYEATGKEFKLEILGHSWP